jgi:hypothetical protein
MNVSLDDREIGLRWTVVRGQDHEAFLALGTHAAAVGVSLIALSGTARAQLVGGQVDVRLMLAIEDLAAEVPVDILAFGNIGPPGDADLPLRYADLAVNDPAAHLAAAVYLRSIVTALGTVPGEIPSRAHGNRGTPRRTDRPPHRIHRADPARALPLRGLPDDREEVTGSNPVRGMTASTSPLCSPRTTGCFTRGGAGGYGCG